MTKSRENIKDIISIIEKAAKPISSEEVEKIFVDESKMMSDVVYKINIEPSLVLDNEVSRIKAIVANRGTGNLYEQQIILLELTTKDGKNLFQVEKSFGETFLNEFKKLNPVIDQAFEWRGSDPAEGMMWKSRPITDEADPYGDSPYGDAAHSFYKALRSHLAKILATHLKEQHVSAVSMMTYGTGEGDDLFSAVDELKKSGMKVRGVGFDYNEGNIKTATKRYAGITDMAFHVGDTLEARQLFLEHKGDFKDISAEEKSRRVALFSGALTRDVLPGTLSALITVQQLNRFCDMSIFSGITSLMVTQHMAKQCGWITKETPPFTEEKGMSADVVIKLLEKPTEHDRQKWLLSRLNKHPELLNLTMSADLLKDLSLVADADFNKIKKIDLTYAFILPEEKDHINKLLTDILEKNPHIKIEYTEFNTAPKDDAEKMIHQHYAPMLELIDQLKNKYPENFRRQYSGNTEVPTYSYHTSQRFLAAARKPEVKLDTDAKMKPK